MNQGIDINLDEVVGALKQASYVNIHEGNSVEEFHRAEVRKMTDKTTYQLGDLKLYVIPPPEKLEKKSSNVLFKIMKENQYQRVLVYDRTEGEEETKHCVFIQNDMCNLGKQYHFCINSWGNFEKNPVIEVDRQGNVVYGIVVQWTPISKHEPTSKESQPSRPVPARKLPIMGDPGEPEASNCTLM